MKKKKDRKKGKEGIVEEAQSVYKTVKLGEIYKTITVSTLEEQEEEMRAYSASLNKKERMAYLYDLICRAYGDMLDKSDKYLWDKTIYIDKK